MHINLKVSQLAFGSIILGLLLLLSVKFYKDQLPALVTFILNGQYTDLIKSIHAKGVWNVVDGGNRQAGNWSELYRLSVYVFGFILVVITLSYTKYCTTLRKYLYVDNFNIHLFAFLILSLSFCFIPSFVFTAGLASVISYEGIVNRYYFASFAFVAIPLLLFMIFKNRILKLLPK